MNKEGLCLESVIPPAVLVPDGPFLTPQRDEVSLKEYLYQKGPVAVGMEAVPPFESYTGGIW